jgi:hypothetical protein
MKNQGAILGSILVSGFSYGVLGVITPASFVTSSDGVYKLTSYTAPVKGGGSSSIPSTWALSIDDTISGHKQSITGFGGTLPQSINSNI